MVTGLNSDVLHQGIKYKSALTLDAGRSDSVEKSAWDLKGVVTLLEGSYALDEESEGGVILRVRGDGVLIDEATVTSTEPVPFEWKLLGVKTLMFEIQRARTRARADGCTCSIRFSRGHMLTWEVRHREYRSGSSKKSRIRRIRRIRRVAALVTIMLLVIGSSVMWFVTGGVEAQAGTLGSLKEASRAGAWQSIEPQKVDVPGEITENRPVSLDHLRDVVNVENVESFVIQVMVTAQESDAIVSLGEKAESADPLVRVAVGQTASVTSLVYGPVSGEGPYGRRRR